MKISVRNLEPTKVRLTVTVDPEEFDRVASEIKDKLTNGSRVTLQWQVYEQER